MRAVGHWCLRLDTLTGAVTVLSMYLIGQHSAWGWLLALANQALWAALIWRGRLWGLVPLTATLSAIYARNLAIWWWP